MAYQDVKTPWEGWRVINKIGKGGFGSVYEIERSQYGIQERAAMKVITIPQSADEIDDLLIEGYDNNSITQRFDAFAEDIVREYGMMAQMKGNANIVYCDDYRIIQQDNGFGRDIYIRMELLTPLLKAMDQVSSESQIIRFGMEMCNALEACQRRKVIHRDIKPQNIFVSDDGVFKLGDFGIARKAEKTTRATVGKGTYQFMAPEVKNEQPYGPTVDMYSLGLVMYWLLNNRRCPFFPLPPAVPTHSEEQEALRRRFSGEPIPAPKNGSGELKRIVLKACAFDPKDRYQSAQEMREELVRLSGGYMTVPDIETIPDQEPTSVPDYDEAETVGPVFDRFSNNSQVEEDKTTGPVFKPVSAKDTHNLGWRDEVSAQQPYFVKPPAEKLDVWQTLRFAYGDNPSGKMINVQVGNETVRVRIPYQFENGQTFCYEGMGMKSAYSGARGNLYLRLLVTFTEEYVKTTQSLTTHQTKEKATNSQLLTTAKNKSEKKPIMRLKKAGLIAIVLVCILLAGGIVWGLSSRGENSADIPTMEKWKQNILMQDSFTSGEEGWKMLDDGATLEDLIAYCAQHPVLGSDIPRNRIVSVTFLDTVISAPDSSWDVSAVQNRSVLAWVIPNGEFYDLYLAGDGGVNGTLATPNMFAFYTNLIEICFNGNFYTEYSTDMSNMFTCCISLESVDIGSLNTSSVLSMGYMFDNCYSLSVLDMSGVNTSMVTDMAGMFKLCTSLRTLDLSGFETSFVTDMELMFYHCSSMEVLDLSGFDTSSVTNMAGMFAECFSLKTLDVSNFDTSAVVDMSSMFQSCDSLTTLDLKSFDTASAINMADVFLGCSSLRTLDLSGFDTSSATKIHGMFYNCSSLTTLDVSGFDTSSVISMSGLFYGCSSLTTLDVSGFDTSAVIDMTCMFQFCSSLTTLDVRNFNTSSVMYMNYMFSECTSLQSLDVTNFDISNAVQKEGFFISNGVVRYEGY